MKTKRTKRGLATLLALCMALFAVPFTAHAAAVTGIWVNGVDIVAAQDNTVQCGEGTAVYESSTKTLTLTNATLTETDIYRTCNIMVYDDLNLVLIGENTIDRSQSSNQGIIVDGVLSITGNGSLAISSTSDGILSGGNLSIEDVGLTINNSQYSGLSSGAGIKIENAAVTTTCVDDSIICEADLTISNSIVNVTSTESKRNGIATFGGKLIIENNSNVTATSTYPALFGNNAMNISDSTIKAVATADYGIWSPGALTITGDSDVTATGSLGSLGSTVSATITPPTGKKVEIKLGSDENSAAKVEGSPFTGETDIKTFGQQKYFHSKNVDAPTPEARDTTITATASIPSPTYTVTIPATVDAGDLVQKAEADADKVKSTTFSVSASSVENLFGAKKVVVSLSTADGTFALKNGEDSLEYAVYNKETGGTALTSGANFTEFTSATSVTGRVDIDQSKITKKGSYTGVMTFSISLADIA